MDKNIKDMNSIIKTILVIAIVLLVVTVLMGWGLTSAFAGIEDVSVSVDYDIAGIIAALLGGSGIAIAGIGFANSKFVVHSDKKDKE